MGERYIRHLNRKMENVQTAHAYLKKWQEDGHRTVYLDNDDTEIDVDLYLRIADKVILSLYLEPRRYVPKLAIEDVDTKA